MFHRAKRLSLACVLLLPVLGLGFGGWAVVTVDDVPTHLVTGKATPISFVVRQHGNSLLPDLSPSVVLSSGSTEATTMASSTGQRGRYQATVVPPSPGMWTVTVKSGFGPSKTTLLPLRATAPNAPAPRTLADAERGRQLFYGKGCVTCHVRGADGDGQIKAGPELTGRRYAADVVAKFLDNPESSPLSKANANQYGRMPKLGLSPAEIGSLVAFLNTTEVAERP
jgi:mono/diheme cytochrome c family protein